MVSRVTSGGIGYTLGTSIAFAYLPPDLAPSGTSPEVEVFGDRVGAVVVNTPQHDPKGERLRA